MESLSNTLLLESYFQAKSLHLSEDFIQILLHEIEKRELDSNLPYYENDNTSNTEHSENSNFQVVK